MNSVEQLYRAWQKSSLFYKHHGEGNAPELSYITLGLAGEAGETADIVKKIVRVSGQLDKDHFMETLAVHRQDLIKELGDVLYYLVRVAQFIDGDIDVLLMANVHKLMERHKHRSEMWPFMIPRASVADWIEVG